MGELEPEVTKKDESFDRTVTTNVHESSFSSSSEEDSIEEGTCGKAKVLPPPGEGDEQQRIVRRRRTVRVMIVAAIVVAAVIGATVAATSRKGSGSSSTAANIPDNFPSSGHGGGTGPKTQEGTTPSRPGPGAQSAGTTAAPQEVMPLPPPSYGGSPPSVNCNTPPAWADDDMGWDDLTPDQRSAASYLGYTPSLWNDEDFWNGGTGTREEASFNARYADLEWTDLTVGQQVAFAYLGYGSGSYSDFYNNYSFDELPTDVQAAADAVGYDRGVWDSCTAEVCSSQVDNDLWQDHSRTERANLKVLGYTCWTWNNYDFGSGGRRGRV